MGKIQEITRYTDQAAATMQMALKIRDAVLASMTDDECDADYLFDEAIWLAMQMLCGPLRATRIVSQCQVQ